MIDAEKNISSIDRFWAVINPAQNLHNLKYELFYKPFGKPDKRMLSSSSGIIRMVYNGTALRFNDIGTGMDGILYYTFTKEEYGRLDVRGKQVIDVGSYVGDTAIYFAVNGAAEVIGYEALPKYYKQANANVKLNKLGRKVRIFNKKVTSLDSIPIKKGAILKIDCEGCEYPTMTNSKDSTIKKLSEIMMEYHYGYIDLKKRLEGLGFHVEVSRPHKGMENNEGRVGMLYARKKGD